MSDDLRLEILQLFAEAGDHGRCYVHRDPLRRNAGGDSVWRQRMTPIVYWAALQQRHAAQEAERYRSEPVVRKKAQERYQKAKLEAEEATAADRRAQDARVEAAVAKMSSYRYPRSKTQCIVPDGLARARVLCLDCRKLPAGVWCFTHERITTMRHKLEKTRHGVDHHFVIIARKDPDDDKNMELVEIDGYIIANVDAAGRLGEIFMRVGKIGHEAAIIDQWAVSTSIALQRGEPVRKLFSKFEHTNFWPYGRTQNVDIPQCSSILDYVAKFILKQFKGVPNWENEPVAVPVVDSTEETTKP